MRKRGLRAGLGVRRGGALPRPYTPSTKACAFSMRGDAPQGYLLRCVGIAPYVPSAEACAFSMRGDAPQGYLLRCVGIAPYVPSAESVCVSLRRFFSLDRLLQPIKHRRVKKLA